MLRALRRMRARLLAEGQFGRYLRYALGELVLVVVGILIALQLNTANQKRVEQGKVHGYARAMIGDLEADLAMLEPIQREMEGIRDRVERLGKYVAETPLEEMRNVDLFFLMRAPYYRPYIWNRAALEQMQASGALRQMENRQLAGMISSYDAMQRHLLDDFVHDREIAVRALALAQQVVDMNYPSMWDRVEKKTLKRGQPFFDWSAVEGSALFTEFAALDKDMLRRDPVLLGEAVNAYQALLDSYGLWPRMRIELEETEGLPAGIRRLIAALEAEYPEEG